MFVGKLRWSVTSKNTGIHSVVSGYQQYGPLTSNPRISWWQNAFLRPHPRPAASEFAFLMRLAGDSNAQERSRTLHKSLVLVMEVFSYIYGHTRVVWLILLHRKYKSSSEGFRLAISGFGFPFGPQELLSKARM